MGGPGIPPPPPPPPPPRTASPPPPARPSPSFPGWGAGGRGPEKAVLGQCAPSLLNAIEDNPSLLPMIMEHPLFQKYIAPRLAALLGRGPVQTATEVEDYGSVVR